MKKIFKASLLVLCSLLIIAEIFILVKSRIYENNTVEAGLTFDEPATELETAPITDIIYIETPSGIEIVSPTQETETTEELTQTELPAESTETTETIETTAVDEIAELETTELSIQVMVTPPSEAIETTADNNADNVLISKNVPILMYHTSSENNPGYYAELYVKPSEFERQIKYLSDNGFTFCTFDDYYNLNNISKPVFITFDDGYRENYTEIFPILQKYNAKITLFLIVNSITDTNLTKDMVVEMSNSGLVKFESHTYTHPSLTAISGNDKRLTEELRDSKTAIEEITRKSVIALCYPNGEFNDIVKEKTKEYYSFGVRKDLGMHNTDYDAFEVRRIRINRSTSLATFKSLVI